MIRYIVKAVEISLSQVYFILKVILQVQQISSSYLLIDYHNVYEYKLLRLICSISEFNQRQFANNVPGNENWAHYFKPVRKF